MADSAHDRSSIRHAVHPGRHGVTKNKLGQERRKRYGLEIVVAGVGNGKYKPDSDITRTEYAAIVVRALGLAPGTGTSTFHDVDSGAWYRAYIATASSCGIIQGYGATTFGPNDKITREQAMTMIARAMAITRLAPELTDAQIASHLDKFADASAISDYAKASVAACTETGVVLGRPDQTIAHKDFITRAEVAVIVERMLQKSNLI